MLTGTTFQKKLVPLRDKNLCEPHPQNIKLISTITPIEEPPVGNVGHP